MSADQHAAEKAWAEYLALVGKPDPNDIKSVFLVGYASGLARGKEKS